MEVRAPDFYYHSVISLLSRVLFDVVVFHLYESNGYFLIATCSPGSVIQVILVSNLEFEKLQIGRSTSRKSEFPPA